MSHNLGRRPALLQFFLRCKTAQYNYSVGDEIMLGGYHSLDGGAFLHGVSACISAGNTSDVTVFVGNAFAPVSTDRNEAQCNAADTGYTLTDL